MKVTFSLLFLLSISMLSFSQRNAKLKINGYLIDDEFPIIGSDGKLKKLLKDSCYFYKANDISIYQIPYYSYHDSIHFNEFQYIIFKEKDKIALWYTDFETPNWINLDSFLVKQDFYLNSKHFYSIFTDSSYTIVKRNYSRTKDSLFEEYFIKSRKDTSKTACYNLVFTTSLKHSPISLSPELDSLRKMKLCIIKIINHPYYYKDKKILIEELHYGTYLSEIKVVNFPKLKLLYREFIKKRQAYYASK